jgi:chemotaxis protein histidine kinase CheA
MAAASGVKQQRIYPRLKQCSFVFQEDVVGVSITRAQDAPLTTSPGAPYSFRFEEEAMVMLRDREEAQQKKRRESERAQEQQREQERAEKRRVELEAENAREERLEMERQEKAQCEEQARVAKEEEEARQRAQAAAQAEERAREEAAALREAAAASQSEEERTRPPEEAPTPLDQAGPLEPLPAVARGGGDEPGLSEGQAQVLRDFLDVTGVAHRDQAILLANALNWDSNRCITAFFDAHGDMQAALDKHAPRVSSVEGQPPANVHFTFPDASTASRQFAASDTLWTVCEYVQTTKKIEPACATFSLVAGSVAYSMLSADPACTFDRTLTSIGLVPFGSLTVRIDDA